MGDARLKDITKDDVVFAEATPAQQLLAWRLNGVSWAAPMSVDQYIKRETALSETKLSSSGGCKYIILHRKSDPEDIISSVEATRKEVLIADHDGLRKARAYAIASVYTNPVYRERGMATFMLRKLQDLMDEDSDCSALYSDIGTVYYDKLGWPVYPSLQVGLALQGSGGRKAPAGVRFLAENEIQPLCEADVKAVTEEFEALGRTDGAVHVAFLPTWSQVQWHFTRAGFMAKILHDREIEHRGAITDDGKSWIYWDQDFREKKLKVIRIVTEQSSDKVGDTVKLLQAATAEAEEWALEKVLVWNPDEATSTAAKSVAASPAESVSIVFDERLDGSIPSLRWKDGKKPETAWDHNDYYAWC